MCPFRLTPLVVPGVELAVIVHLGNHTEIDRAYGSLGTHLAEHALAVEGSIREYDGVVAMKYPTSRSGEPRSAGPFSLHRAARGKLATRIFRATRPKRWTYASKNRAGIDGAYAEDTV
jgi:hypothetical protein